MSLSFSQLLWQTIELPGNQSQINHLCRTFQISPAFAKILMNRNLCEVEEIEQFLNPSISRCHNPFLMHDMQKAIDRLYQALLRREKVLIYGDYDVDGTVGTVILYRYLKRIGFRTFYFIPRRLQDGYGMSKATLLELKRKKAEVIITVDNGITAVEEAKFLRGLGIDLIVTDHHLLVSGIPTACAILNPQQPQCLYPFKGLCGTGVAFKMLTAFDQFLTDRGYWEFAGYIRPDLQRDLDLVAFATIADRVPLVDENRCFVKLGLEIINTTPRPGIQTLIKGSNVRGPITPNVISFKLAPIINAVGRLGDPNTGVSLLIARSQYEAKPFASMLIQVNYQRRQIERKVFNAALALAHRQKNKDLIILVGDNWHSGVIGSVAARIAGRFQKPTVILTLYHDKQAMGSIRGVGDFDVCAALQNCEHLLDKFGGHKKAAGLSLDVVNVNAFCNKLKKIFASHDVVVSHTCTANYLTIEAWVNSADLKQGFVEELLLMSPFGMQNPEPVLGMRGTEPKNIVVIGNQHLKFDVDICELDVEVFAWDHFDWYTKLGGACDIAMTFQMRNTSRETLLQFKAIDIKAST